MILESLYRLALEEDLVGDPDFQGKGIHYRILLSQDGSTANIQQTFESAAKGPARPAIFEMPTEATRSSAARAFFLFDKADYVFGVDPDGERAAAELEARRALFREKVAACAEATEDEGARAVLEFLDRTGPEQAQELLPEGCLSNYLFTFQFATDDHPIVHRPAIRKYWKDLRREIAEARGVKRCSVSGVLEPPARLHPQLKLPGGSTAGVPMVSFNKSAFESYGWSKNENAPVSQGVAEAYAEALRTLLAKPRSDEESGAPVRHLALSPDTVVCFWSDNVDWANAFQRVMTVNASAASESYRGIWRGEVPKQFRDASSFYALTLTGTQGRAISRGWFRSTAGEVAKAVALYFRDLQLVRLTPPPKRGGHPPAVPLRVLMESLAPLGQLDKGHVNLMQQVFEAAIGARPLPWALLRQALRREVAEASRDDWKDKNRCDARRAVIKAVLERSRRRQPHTHDYPELRPVLDPNNSNRAYLLGRLLAFMETLQAHATPGVNASMSHRYFGAALASPATVFPRLSQASMHHLTKAMAEPTKANRAVDLARERDLIFERFDPKEGGFPAHLDSEQQGLFVLGLHHQMHDLFKSRGERESRAAEESGTGPAAEVTAPGYLLGRAMAVFERLQALALSSDLNASVVD
ncbi:MAG: type I-C CRISPR-associated protein Cas8c/Csd1, partial [Acidobacteriota bacterium]